MLMLDVEKPESNDSKYKDQIHLYDQELFPTNQVSQHAVNSKNKKVVFQLVKNLFFDILEFENWPSV